MDIKWTIEHLEPARCSCSYHVFADIKRLKQEAERTGKLVVYVERRTKTTLNIEMIGGPDGQDVFGVAHIPAGAECFKFVEQSGYSYIHGSYCHHYFRISKKQGLAELKEYLSLVLDELHLNVSELSVDLRIRDVEELNAA